MKILAMYGRKVRVFLIFLLLLLCLVACKQTSVEGSVSNTVTELNGANNAENTPTQAQVTSAQIIESSKTQDSRKPLADSERIDATKTLENVPPESATDTLKEETEDAHRADDIKKEADVRSQESAGKVDAASLPSGQSKDARISPEVPVASQAPPSVQVPVYLAPSSAVKPNDDEKNELFGNTPALSPSHTDSESSQQTGNEDVQPIPEVAPPGGEVPDRPEKPDISQGKTVRTAPDVGGEKDLREVETTPQDVDIADDLQGQGQGQAAGDIAKSGEKVDKPEVKDSPKSTDQDPTKESEVIQEKGGENVDKVGTEDGKSLPLAGVMDTTDKESADLTEKPSDDKEGQGQGHNEDPIVTEQHEDIPSFDEWKKKTLAEEEKKQTNGKFVHLSEPTALTKRPSTMRTNYASLSCGAKVLAHNAEVQHAEYVLSDNKDQYMINPCTVEKKWFVVELCEPIQVKFIDIANFELFSSLPESFKVYTSDRYPSKEWKWLGIFYAKGERKIQSFPIHGQELYSKYVRIEMITHYGTEHFCPISLLRIFGKSYADIDDDDQHDGSHDDMTSQDGATGDKTVVDDSASGNIFTSATDLVLNVVKKVLNVNGQESEKTENASLGKSDTVVNTTVQTTPEPTTEPGCHGDQKTGKDQIKPDVPRADVTKSDEGVNAAESAHLEPSTSPGVPRPTPATPTFSVLLTSLVKSRCYACSIRQSNYRTYRPIIGPDRCVYMYTMLSSAHARGLAQECSCRHCRRVRLTTDEQHSVITPPIAGQPTRQTSLLDKTLLHSEETDIGVTMATETGSDQKIAPTSASVEATQESVTSVPPVTETEASHAGPEVVQAKPETITTQTDVVMETKSQELPSVESTKLPEGATKVDVNVNTNIDQKNGYNDINPDEVVTNNRNLDSNNNNNNLNIINVQSASDSIDNSNNQNQQDPNTATDDSTIPTFENADPGFKMGDVMDAGLDFMDQSSDLPVAGPASAGKRESAIMRINNRLKKLEFNMSLSSRYLEELSQTYRKQMDTMYKSFNKTIARLTNTSRLAAISEQRQQENIQALRKQLGELGNTVAAMQKTIDSMHIKYLETHLFWIVVETIIMIGIVMTCTRRGASRQQVQAMIDEMPERPRTRTISRRLSDSYIHGSPHKSLLRRSGSDSNLYIVEPSLPFLIDEKAPNEIQKEKKRRKPKKSKRSVGSAETTPVIDDSNLPPFQNGYHGYQTNHVTRSVSLENVAAMSDVQTMTSSSDVRTSSSGLAVTSERRQSAKPVEFIGPLDFYEKRSDRGRKKKQKENSSQKLQANSTKRKTPLTIGPHKQWTKPHAHQSQPLFHIVQNGSFGVRPSPRSSPRGSPQNSRRNSPEMWPSRVETLIPWYRGNDASSEIYRLPQLSQLSQRPNLNGHDCFSDSGWVYGKRGGKFPGKKTKVKGPGYFLDQMER